MRLQRTTKVRPHQAENWEKKEEMIDRCFPSSALSDVVKVSHSGWARGMSVRATQKHWLTSILRAKLVI